MRKSSARKRTFLPQLRQTTKLAKFNQKAVFGFLETRFFQSSKKNRKEKEI